MLAIIYYALFPGLVAAATNAAVTAPSFYKGFDLSSLALFENSGVVFKDAQNGNATRACEDILGDGGMNTVRLRLWVDPTVGDQWGTLPGFYGLNYTLPLAKRMVDKGYNIYLDFHFDNYWADPNKQAIPPSWPQELKPLAATLRRYVSNTLQTFWDAGVKLSIVSLGNEIRHGMLWPTGYVEVDTFPDSARATNYTNLSVLLKSARQGVRDAVKAGVPKPQVMIHIDNGWNLTLQQNWFKAVTASGHLKTSDWDIFGFSCYPFYGIDATLDNLATSLNAMAVEYRKPIHVVETDWPALCPAIEAGSLVLSDTKIPISAKGQTQWVRGIGKVVQNVAYGLGQGVNYWEPAFLNNSGLGSACDDALLFSTDWSEYPKITTYSRSSVNMFKKGFPQF